MRPTCKNYVDCPVPASYPLTGYNAETSEVIGFIARGFGPVTPPPLNWSFELPFAYATGTSTVSEQAAETAAIANAVTAAQNTWVAPNETPPIIPGDNAIPNFDDVFWDMPII